MYYTYELVDPRCGSVFYVGKGKGDRRFAHVKEARKGAKGRKCDRIRAILAEGAEPTARIVKHYADELEAYAAEAALIDSHGLANLTNVSIGGIGCVTPPDPRREARKAVRSCLGIIERCLKLRSEGVSIVVKTASGPMDFVLTTCDIAKRLREKAGEQWFDRTLGIA